MQMAGEASHAQGKETGMIRPLAPSPRQELTLPTP